MGVPRFSPPARSQRPVRLPSLIRFSRSSELELQLKPQQALASMREGTATAASIDTLGVRIRWGLLMSMELFTSQEVVAVMQAADKAIAAVRKRLRETGKVGATGEEFFQIGNALSWTDSMQLKSTRKEMLPILLRAQGQMKSEAARS